MTVLASKSSELKTSSAPPKLNCPESFSESTMFLEHPKVTILIACFLITYKIEIENKFKWYFCIVFMVSGLY